MYVYFYIFWLHSIQYPCCVKPDYASKTCYLKVVMQVLKTINCLDTLGGMVVAVGAAAAVVVVEHDYIVEAPDADSTAMVEAVEVEMNLQAQNVAAGEFRRENNAAAAVVVVAEVVVEVAFGHMIDSTQVVIALSHYVVVVVAVDHLLPYHCLVVEYQLHQSLTLL